MSAIPPKEPSQKKPKAKAKKTSRQNLKPPGKCIFCEQGGLSREHIWPDWLKNYLERPGPQTRHVVSNSGASGARTGRMHRPGDIHSQRLRVVCRACNSGWMSRLQTAAKPFIARLLNDDWLELDAKAQSTLSAWATMFTMVSEFADRPTAMVPQIHRNFLMNNGQVPEHWHIWMGRVDFKNRHPANANHFGLSYISNINKIGLTSQHQLQTTGFTVGKLFFQTYMLTPPDPDVVFNPDIFAALFDLKLITPQRGIISERPKHIQSRDDFYTISNGIASNLGIEPFVLT